MEQSSPSITYVPRPGATPEAEWAALAALYRFVLFDSSASKEIAPSSHKRGPEAVQRKTPPAPAAPMTQ